MSTAPPPAPFVPGPPPPFTASAKVFDLDGDGRPFNRLAVYLPTAYSALKPYFDLPRALTAVHNWFDAQPSWPGHSRSHQAVVDGLHALAGSEHAQAYNESLDSFTKSEPVYVVHPSWPAQLAVGPAWEDKPTPAGPAALVKSALAMAEVALPHLGSSQLLDLLGNPHGDKSNPVRAAVWAEVQRRLQYYDTESH